MLKDGARVAVKRIARAHSRIRVHMHRRLMAQEASTPDSATAAPAPAAAAPSPAAPTTDAAPTPAAASTPAAAPTPVDTAAQPPKYQFEDLRLKAGDRMQIQLPVNVTEEKQIVRLIGFLEKQCLLITLPANLSWQKRVREGDKVIARVFLGRGAFGFTSQIHKVIRSPFDYLHLTWPTEFQGLLIRKAPRVKTELAAKVQTAAGSVETQVVNLSATGMMLRSTAALGAKGEELSVTLPLALYDVTTELALRGTIKLVNPSKDETGEFHLSGVEFVNLQPNETLILQSVVHHELGRNPYSVV